MSETWGVVAGRQEEVLAVKLFEHQLKRAIVKQFGFDGWTAEKTTALVKKKAAFVRNRNLLLTTHKMLRYGMSSTYL